MSTSIEATAFKSSSLVSELAAVFEFSPVVVDPQDLPLVSAVAGDDISVDEFFDLQGLSDDDQGLEKGSSSCSPSLSVDEGASFSGTGDFSADFSDLDGLAIPADDIKELELWSHLMDGALYDDFFACPTRNPYVTPGPNRARFDPKLNPAMVDASRFPPPAFTKPRTKRSKPISGSWSSSSLLEPESSMSSITSSAEPVLVRVTKNRKTGVKRIKRNPDGQAEDGESVDGPAKLRKCTHCQVEETPQWRTGPLGPKTLCNACGVRFKSGRLFPEYRPACSPTFSSEIHSNSHRKVVEMRKRKIAEPGLASSILSC